MISLLISLLVLILIFAIVWWILSLIPVPPQFRWIAQVVLGIILLLCLLGFLTGGIGFPALHPLR